MMGYKKVQRLLKKLARHEEGQDLIEYALTASFIAVAVAAFFPTSIAPNICQIFSKVTSILTQGS